MISYVTTLNRCSDQNILDGLRAIFFISTSSKFENDNQKDQFFNRWANVYFERWPELTFLYIENDRVLGYVCGTLDSDYFLTIDDVPTLRIFQDYFKLYPAHLHINCHPDARSKGVGSILLDHFFANLRLENVIGCHIVTSAKSQNISFYKKNNFSFCIERLYKNSSLLFMGRPL